MPNIDNLNFKVILNDTDFNKRVKADIEAAKKLNTQLSTLLNVKAKINSISAQEAASAKRASDIAAKQAIDQERIKKAAAATAVEEEKVGTQAAKTAKELARAEAATKAAALSQQRMATEAQRTAKETNNAVASAQRLKTETQRTATEVQRTAKETKNAERATYNARLAQRKLRDYSAQTANHVRTQSRLMNELKGYALGYLSIHGASQLLDSLIRITGEFEVQKSTLGAMLGDLNQAENIITRIQGLAVESPFQFRELTTYAKQLSAFSVPAQELYDTTKMLADVSAGLGVGMDRIVLAYGQVRSAAFLRGQEVRQFTEAGIPILDELAKQFTELEGRAVSTGEVFDKISARLVPFEMVAKVFKDMTSEGGKFYNMQEVQAETLRGKLSNLKDAYEVMLNEIGSQKSGTMKSAVDGVKNLMQNWEKVGNILKTVIAAYGGYKATLGVVWAVEKAMNATRSVTLFNLLTMKRGVDQVAASNRVFGMSLTMVKQKLTKLGTATAVGAILAIATAIATAIKNANALRKELESIMSAEFNNSNKAANDIERLVGNLQKANKGSQEYRETISELNRKYGEYLPNILTEADSYEKVKNAANAAAEAIRNKAKANAFEKGSAAIEDDLGTDLNKRTSAFRSALTNMPSISNAAASEFIKNFNVALAKDGAMDDVEKTLRETFDSYFGDGKFEEYEMSFSLGTLIWDAKKYAETRDKVIEAEKQLQDNLDARFVGAAFSSLEEREKVSEIEQWYRDELSNNDNALKKLTLTQEEYNKKVSELDIEKLRKLADAYDVLGRADIAESYRKQIEQLTKIPDGWRGSVQQVLKDMGLSKESSFGLWADETTQSTAFVDEMIKRYKELDEEIKMVSSFDEAQTKRLQQNKDAILAVAKALKIDIDTLAADKGRTKSSAQIELETRIELVKKLQDAYEKLMPYLTDAQMKSTLKSLFPEAKEEWFKSFDFSEVLRKLADELAKYDTEASEKLKSSIGKDVAGSLADAFKEIEAYKKMLDEWMGEDFNLEGKGVSFDISKIIRDLNNQYAQIDQKRLKAQELLKKAQMGDEEALKIVREVYGEDVWKKYLTMGSTVINELASKEKQSARDVAYEKIRDKATSYVSEEIKKKNIDLSDFDDKSIGQIQTLIDRLKDIRDKAQEEANKAFVDVALGKIDDGQYAKWQMLLEVVELLGIKIEDTEDELDKKLMDNVKDSIDIISDLGSAISNLGNDIDNANLEMFGKQLNEVSNLATGLIEAFQAKDTIAIIANVLSYAISSIAEVAAKAYEAQQRLYENSLEYRDLMNDIARESYLGIFGTDELALAAENTRILTDAQREYTDALNKLEEKKFQKNKATGGTWKTQSVSDILGYMADAQGWELYRENGELNIQAIEVYYDSFSQSLTRKQRELVDEIIQNGNALDDASAQQAEYLTNLFSGIADDIASSMVDAFIESGDAAMDMGSIISDVSKQMVADLIKSVYLMPILNDYVEQFDAIQANDSLTPTEKTEAQLNLLDTALQEISGQSDAITETIERFSEHLGIGENGTTDAADAIKGITEDQANLLVSYINAMRSDVALIRSLQSKHLPAIGESMPTIMDHLAKIEANTLNIADRTQNIYERLGTVIGFGDNGDAIRIIS